MSFSLRCLIVLLLGLAPAVQSASNSPTVYIDVTGEAGISWVHTNGMSPQRYLPETMNGGGAFLDYNNDGWMDIYLVNSGQSDFFKPNTPLRNALYENNKDGTFKDVTVRAGVAGRGFGMGAAAGDFDSDGWPDILVTGVEFAILYRNRQDGTFVEVTQKANLNLKGWSTSAAWLDYDNDGKLDLYVCRFVTWTPALNIQCGNVDKKGYCLPTIFQGAPSWLFRNNGDGTFTDVSKETGIANARGKGLGVVAADIDNDRWIDIFHANDTEPNYLYKNRGDGHFADTGLVAGVAYSRDGKARSGMGVDAQDYNADGWVDLFVANIDQEFFSLYKNNGDGTFEDEGINTPEMVSATRNMSGWGARFVDIDNDASLDLVVLNGHPDDRIQDYQPQVTYRERPHLFLNTNGRLKNHSAAAGEPFQKEYPGRGLATGDFDNDGDLDLLFCNNGQAPILLRNQGGNRNNWLGVRLQGTKSNRDGIGARLVYRIKGKAHIYYVAGGGSYLSSHDPRILLGLSELTQLDELRVEWPSGTVDVLKKVNAGQYLTVREGEFN